MKMSNALWTMTALSAGTDDITSEAGQIITSIPAITMTAPSYSNLSSTYIKIAISGGISLF